MGGLDAIIGRERAAGRPQGAEVMRPHAALHQSPLWRSDWYGGDWVQTTGRDAEARPDARGRRAALALRGRRAGQPRAGRAAPGDLAAGALQAPPGPGAARRHAAARAL